MAFCNLYGEALQQRECNNSIDFSFLTWLKPKPAIDFTKVREYNLNLKSMCLWLKIKKKHVLMIGQFKPRQDLGLYKIDRQICAA